MPNKRLGTYKSYYIGEDKYKAFIPPKLSPMPEIDMTGLLKLLEEANREIGALNSVTDLIPSHELFIYMYVRKEALLSSQIEGTQSSFSDLMLYENKEIPGVPIDDVEEVSNYVAAMNYGLQRLKDGFPLSLRLIKEMHAILLRGGRGAKKTPGEFRRSQNWISGTRPGTARFVPPPPEMLLDILSDFEKFLHEENDVPVLIKTGLAHVQFETIHPFLDGNGRLGRLLITLLLCTDKALKDPILYLSLFFKQHRSLYYDHLQNVRVKGAWEEWLTFFLEGIRDTSKIARLTAQKMIKLFEKNEKQIERLGRARESARKVFELFKTKPLNNVPNIAKTLDITAPTARASVNHLIKLGILNEISGRERDKIYAYKDYMELLNEGIED
jgi:Fic family protein